MADDLVKSVVSWVYVAFDLIRPARVVLRMLLQFKAPLNSAMDDLHRKTAALMVTSVFTALIGFPEAKLSRNAISGAYSSNKSAIFAKTWPRFAQGSVDQGPVSKASTACRTALSTSSLLEVSRHTTTSFPFLKPLNVSLGPDPPTH